MRHGETQTKLYYVWRAMKERCNNPLSQNSKGYYRRGIIVCPEWEKDFLVFKKWALENGYQEGLFLDRRDNDLGYNPDNCRWTTEMESALHRRDTVKRYEAFGESKTIRQWVDDPRCSVGYQGLYRRLKNGMPPEQAIATPAQPGIGHEVDMA